MVRASSADKAAYALSFSSCRMLRLMEEMFSSSILKKPCGCSKSYTGGTKKGCRFFPANMPENAAKYPVSPCSVCTISTPNILPWRSSSFHAVCRVR